MSQGLLASAPWLSLVTTVWAHEVGCRSGSGDRMGVAGGVTVFSSAAPLVPEVDVVTWAPAGGDNGAAA